jgi:DHA1 family tetracycline resistance protein-like MFS transporter
MNTKRALTFIFCTAALDILALGLIIPVLPPLILQFRGGDTAAASEAIGLFMTVWGLMQFVFSPLLGSLSDRYGRRPVILISCLGMGLDYIFMALAPSLGLLFVGRVVSGITSATLGTAFAYIADVTPPDERAKAFGIIGGAFGLGFVIGPGLGGLLGSSDPRLPFWFAAAACLLNAGFGWFILPESLAPERRMAFSWKRANPLGSLKLLSRHVELWGLATVGFLGNFAHQVLPAVFVLYAGYRYGWGPGMVGLTLALVGVASAIAQGLLVGRIIAWLGERWTLIGGMLAGCLGMLIYGLAPTGMLFWVGVPIMGLWGLASPAAQSLMSRRVGPDEQGQLQGANTSLMSIASIVGPSVFAATFAYFLNDTPSAAWLLAAVFLLVASIVAWLATRARRAAGLRP